MVSTRIAVAVYDFDGEQAYNELSFRIGDRLGICGGEQPADGWLEGYVLDQNGNFQVSQLGLIPAEYVQITDDFVENVTVPPTLPPLPSLLQRLVAEQEEKQRQKRQSSEYQTVAAAAPPPPLPSTATIAAALQKDLNNVMLGNRNQSDSDMQQQHNATTNENNLDCSEFDDSLHDEFGGKNDNQFDTRTINTVITSLNDLSNNNNRTPSVTAATVRVKPSKNFFSPFVSRGFDAFLTKNELPLAYVNDVAIGLDVCADKPLEPHWNVMMPQNLNSATRESTMLFDLQIVGHSTESKFIGTKVFTVFHILEKKSNIVVQRRYKHFEWLHKILSKKFSFVCLPVLPEKQANGRFEDRFIERRKYLLTRYLDRLNRHPLISTSKVFKLFVTCNTASEWKAGKRAAESDDLIGDKLLHSINIHGDLPKLDGDEDGKDFVDVVNGMKVKQLIMRDSLVGLASFNNSGHNYFQKLSTAFSKMVKSVPTKGPNSPLSDNPYCWLPDCDKCTGMISAMENASRILHECSSQFPQNNEHTVAKAIGQLTEYEHNLDSVQLSAFIQHKTIQKLKDWRKQSFDGIIDQSLLEELETKCSKLVQVAYAEATHFHEERDKDFKIMMKGLLEGEAAFYRKLGENLEEASKAFL
jgi:sorting nexin-9/18/33